VTLVRGTILTHKTELLAQFNQFTTRLDASFRNTNCYRLRPYAPGVNFGQETFLSAMGDALVCWKEINAGPPPAGVTLPLLLDDGTSVEDFAGAISALQSLYAEEKARLAKVTLERGNRNDLQADAYAILRAYREAVEDRMKAFAVMVESVPRLKPLPGHTPQPVNASAVFQAPDSTKVAYEASGEPMLQRYELRGTAGEDYDEEDAVVIATRGPEEPREFVTGFGLMQPGAQVALKVYVILTTGNEAGSAALRVQRPASVQPLAA
jgi:hypothetical protein